MATARDVLDYWFGKEPDDGRLADQRGALWWSKNADTDADIRARFEQPVRAAGRGELDAWAQTPHGRLALVILMDQFTRNIYRDTADAFSLDGQALAHTRAAIEAGQDAALRPIERVFLYLPLEHAEDLALQDESVALFEALRDQVPDAHQRAFDVFLDFAVRHREVIARFGRFPHRNAILGRESTAEEVAFLDQPGSSF